MTRYCMRVQNWAEFYRSWSIKDSSVEHSLNPYRASVAAVHIIALAIICDFSSECRYIRQTPH
jgi:hypothetical protein